MVEERAIPLMPVDMSGGMSGSVIPPIATTGMSVLKEDRRVR
jgi:hypothetical protein